MWKERIDGVLHFISCKHYSHPDPSFIWTPWNLGNSQLSWESFTMAVECYWESLILPVKLFPKMEKCQICLISSYLFSGLQGDPRGIRSLISGWGSFSLHRPLLWFGKEISLYIYYSIYHFSHFMPACIRGGEREKPLRKREALWITVLIAFLPEVFMSD